MKNLTEDEVRKLSGMPDAAFNQHVLWDSTGLNPDNCNKILLIYKKVVNHFDIKYWLTYGTALGFYRSGDFIPWDDDIDSHIDGHKMLEVGVENIRQKFIDEGVVVRSKERGLNSKMSLFYGGVKMQLQGVYEQDGMMHAKLFHYPIEFYNNSQVFQYRGEEYTLPGPPDRYLTFCYDENWSTPQDIKDWRDYMNPKQLKSRRWLSDYDSYNANKIKGKKINDSKEES